MTLRLWFNGADTYVAESAKHARALMLEHIGPGGEGDVPNEEAWRERTDATITMAVEYDIGGLTRETRTRADWIQRNGPGFLCSTEW
jgi:hypothetical protein